MISGSYDLVKKFNYFGLFTGFGSISNPFAESTPGVTTLNLFGILRNTLSINII